MEASIMPKIAIIGAGLAGLSCARGLVSVGAPALDITIFDKSRGIGGRMATRYAGAYEFDHGAQYFTAHSDRFGRFTDAQLAEGNISAWPTEIEKIGGAQARETTRFVATPRMNSLCKALAEPLETVLKTRITQVRRAESGWELQDEVGGEYGPFDVVVSAMPAPQMLALLPDAFVEHHTALSAVRMAGCFSLMLGFEAGLAMPWEAARIDGSPVGWIAVNSSKPGRQTGVSVLIQSSNDWAEAHMEDAPEMVQAVLLAEASELAGVDLAGADHTALHRWRYAATPQPLGASFLFDRKAGLAACGDWCLGSKVESAFESGAQLADALLEEMSG
jgi:predicted NAD/FAD-dependent oxidoreductase